MATIRFIKLSYLSALNALECLPQAPIAGPLILCPDSLAARLCGLVRAAGSAVRSGLRPQFYVGVPVLPGGGAGRAPEARRAAPQVRAVVWTTKVWTTKVWMTEVWIHQLSSPSDH